MLDQLLKWIAAGDAALLGNSPIVAIVLAMTGAAGITQTLKFWLMRLINDETVERWTIRVVAVALTWALLTWLSGLELGVTIVIAFIQPYAYTCVMAVIRHRWPWIEATKAAGSVRPSEDARAALLQRRDDVT